MNRCTSARFLAIGTRCLVGTLLVAASLTVTAQSEYLATAPTAVRPFPAQALRAALVVTATPNILIDGQPARLSPGARIYSTNNMLVMSAALTGQQLLVNFVREPTGLVHQVWILTEAEARLPQQLATPLPYSPR